MAALSQKLCAEFIGVFFLVSTWCHVSMAGNPLGPMSVASALMVSVYSLGAVSGAHLNPAVSLGIFLAGIKSKYVNFSFIDMLMYWGVQLLSGAIAALSAGGIHNSELGGPSSWSAAGSGSPTMYSGMNALGPGAGYENWNVFPAEAVYTAVLVFVVLSVATCNDNLPLTPNNYFGLSIGFVIIAAANAIGSITQCSLNPAVSLGSAVGSLTYGTSQVDTGFVFGMFFLYSGAELFGAVLGFACFYATRTWMAKDVCSGSYIDSPRVPKYCMFLSEVLGTFVLTLTVALVVQASESNVTGVIGIACSLTVMIFSLAKVSGANFNPAVSFGLLLAKKLSLPDFGLYVGAQLCGSILTVLVDRLIQGGWKTAFVGLNQKCIHGTCVAEGFWGMIAGSEITYTCLLVFVVLSVAVADAPNQYYGLAIGWVIIAGGVAVGSLSGGMFNPAVAWTFDLGALLEYCIDKNALTGKYGYSLVYTLFELIAAAIAVLLYKLTREWGAGVETREYDSEEGSSAEE